MQTLVKLRATRPGLRGRSTEMLVATDQALVYRRGATIVALNNDTTAASLDIPVKTLGSDLLNACGAPRPAGEGTTITIPARTGCLFPDNAPGAGMGARRRQR